MFDKCVNVLLHQAAFGDGTGVVEITSELRVHNSFWVALNPLTGDRNLSSSTIRGERLGVQLQEEDDCACMMSDAQQLSTRLPLPH